MTVKPNRHLFVHITGERNEAAGRSRIPSFVTDLITGRIDYSLTTRAFFSSLIQWNDVDDLLTANLRLRYEYRPNSDFFLVYGERRETDGGGQTDRSLIAKLTYLFSL